ncbi:MAG TPA: hypothetical protein VFE22_00735 [Edaphobacter sp.]|jgi:hypothetical protein|nr:hypothetical protein [Edaphobacter sp.]
MHIRKAGTSFLTAVLALGMSSAFAQPQDGAKQDMKNAGTETKNAVKDTGHGISKGTQKAYHKTTRGTKKAYHKTAKGTKHAVHKVEGKNADAPQ